MELKKQNFIQTIDKNRGIIRSLCKVYFSSNEDQRDAFQDVILQLWRSFDSFRGEAEISTWIYRVSLNTLLTKVKREKSVKTESMETLDTNIATAKADDDLELLSIIIQSLKDIDKAIVVLHLEGYRNKEIAKILNISSTNVATRFNRVKSQVKRKFKKQAHANTPS